MPNTAAAYSLNVTAVPKDALGFLSIYPSGQTQPNTSTLNSWQGEVVANSAIVKAGTNGEVTVFASDETDVVLDLDGYFIPTPAGQVGPQGPTGPAGATGATWPMGASVERRRLRFPAR